MADYQDVFKYKLIYIFSIDDADHAGFLKIGEATLASMLGPTQDFRPIPSGAKIGDFVHESDVNSFLDLITADSEESHYPFANDAFRDMFRHTLWMVPGVKEARALSALLRRHPVFGNFKVANVAGEGDQEEAYDDAVRLGLHSGRRIYADDLPRAVCRQRERQAEGS